MMTHCCIVHMFLYRWMLGVWIGTWLCFKIIDLFICIHEHKKDELEV